MDFKLISLRDPVSTLTHLPIAFAGLLLTTILWRLAGTDRIKKWSLACFGVCVIVLYAASAAYHAIPLPRESTIVDVFRRLDHSAIYLLIAGTFTPVLAVLHGGRRRIVMLSVIWAVAVLGIAAKWLFPIANGGLAVGLYMAMGWLGVIPIINAWRTIGWAGFFWVGTGGLAYSVGGTLELLRWPEIIPGIVGFHEVFHVCDIVGTTCHVVFMMRCVIPHRRQTIYSIKSDSAIVAHG